MVLTTLPFCLKLPKILFPQILLLLLLIFFTTTMHFYTNLILTSSQRLMFIPYPPNIFLTFHYWIFKSFRMCICNTYVFNWWFGVKFDLIKYHNEYSWKYKIVHHNFLVFKNKIVFSSISFNKSIQNLFFSVLERL